MMPRETPAFPGAGAIRVTTDPKICYSDFCRVVRILPHPRSDHIGTGCQIGKSLCSFATAARNADRRAMDVAAALASPRLRLLDFAKSDERHLDGKPVPGLIAETASVQA
jgi:hypothetical protein